MSWVGWALCSALFAGLTGVFAKAGVRDVDSNLANAVRTSIILVFAWTIVFVQDAAATATLNARAWLFLVLSGLATGASWLCYFRAMKLGQASYVDPIDKLSVVVVVVFAGLFLGETLTWRHGVGVALIVAGSILLTRGAS